MAQTTPRICLLPCAVSASIQLLTVLPAQAILQMFTVHRQKLILTLNIKQRTTKKDMKTIYQLWGEKYKWIFCSFCCNYNFRIMPFGCKQQAIKERERCIVSGESVIFWLKWVMSFDMRARYGQGDRLMAGLLFECRGKAILKQKDKGKEKLKMFSPPWFRIVL